MGIEINQQGKLFERQRYKSVRLGYPQALQKVYDNIEENARRMKQLDLTGPVMPNHSRLYSLLIRDNMIRNGRHKLWFGTRGVMKNE